MSLQFLKSQLDKPNIKAFLKMIQHSEGTDNPKGYNTLFGGEVFDSFADHPNTPFHYTNKVGMTLITTAAGAYQITHTTWAALQAKLGLTDFTPQSQDIAALELISEKDCIHLIVDGNFKAAIDGVRAIWASLPNSGNNQPENSYAKCLQWYQNNGGVVSV